MKINKLVRVFAIIIMSYVTTVCMALIAGYGITGIDVLLPCVFVLCLIVYGKVSGMSGISKRDCIFSSTVGVVFASGLVVGSLFDLASGTVKEFGLVSAVAIVFLSIFFSCVMLIIYKLLDITEPRNGRLARQRITSYPVTVLIIMLCWMPYYLTLFPGNMGKDTFESIDMCLGNIPWSNHHPVFFTLLIDIVIKATGFLKSITISMGIFTFIHMLICALTYAYIVKWLYRKTGFYFAIAAYIFYALHPASAMFSMYISKDVLFSMAMVLLVITVVDMAEANFEVSNVKMLVSGVLSLLVMLLRNNGLFVVAFSLVVFLITGLRKKYKGLIRISLFLTVAIIVFILFKMSAVRLLGIQPESFAESASVPLQQVGYVIMNNEESIDEQDAQFIGRIMNFDKVKKVYTLGYTDPYKFDEEFDDVFFNDNKAEFISVWAHMLPTHFGDYVKAYLAQTIGYWHYGESTTLCTQGIWADNEIGVNRIDVIGDITGVSLYGVIEKLMLVSRKAPVLCILTSMAMQLYMLIVVLAMKLRRKRNVNYILPFVPLIMLWISVMLAAPASCLFRYMYPLFVLWPILCMSLFREYE